MRSAMILREIPIFSRQCAMHCILTARERGRERRVRGTRALGRRIDVLGTGDLRSGKSAARALPVEGAQNRIGMRRLDELTTRNGAVYK